MKMKKRSLGFNTFAELEELNRKEQLPEYRQFLKELSAAGCGDMIAVYEKWGHILANTRTK